MTLLTDGWSPPSEEQRKAKDAAYEKARLIAWDIWYQAYSSGDISLDILLRNAQRSLVKLDVDDFLRWKTLGLLVENALKAEPPKRTRGNKGQPEALRKIARQLVKMANDDGFVLSRSSSMETAFERASNIMAELGVSALPRQVEDWYYETPE